MSVRFLCPSPQALLTAYKKAINDGKVTTWICDQDGDFTYIVDQYRFLAWFRPRIATGQLVCNFVCARGKLMTRPLYGIYHGRFVESVLSHCDSLFTTAQASATYDEGDIPPKERL